MMFIFAFAATPNSSDAFATFLLEHLCFSADTYTYLLATGYLSQVRFIDDTMLTSPLLLREK